MQLDKVLISIGALVCTSLLGIGLTTKEVEAQTARPYVVFVNGYQNCCSWGMTSLQNRLVDQMNAEPRYVPYSNFNNDGRSGNTSTDEQFLRDGEDFINNQLDKNRPLILIGHSFGGDSVLKLLPRINRKIQLVAVIDPVSTGGFRATLSRYTVPSNVDYFFNRWQENVPFPNDFGLNGSISCNARTCDQDSENIARNADFSPITTECRWDEVTCPGFVAPIPFVRNGRKGTQQVRVSHQDLPRSAHIQQVLGDKIQARLALAAETFFDEARPKITSFYRDFLSREPEAGAIESRLNAVRNGRTLEQQRIDIAFSDEARQKITSFYRQYLGRNPEAGAIESRMNALLNGRTLEQQRVDIQNSPEARNRR